MAKIIDVAVIMVANDAQSRAVTRVLLDGDLRKGAVIVVAATNHPRTMIDLDAECAKKMWALSMLLSVTDCRERCKASSSLFAGVALNILLLLLLC